MLIEDAVLNGVGLVGRLVPAYLADQYFGPLNCLIPFVFVSGLLIYCWAAVISPSTYSYHHTGSYAFTYPSIAQSAI